MALDNFIRNAKKIYGRENLDRVRRACYEFRDFKELNHEEALEKAKEVYGPEYENEIKEAFLRFPQFATYNQREILDRINEYHEFKDEDIVKRAILINPQLTEKYTHEETPGNYEFDDEDIFGDFTEASKLVENLEESFR